jgi:integrase
MLFRTPLGRGLYMSNTLTIREILQLTKPKDTEFKITVGRGLYIRVAPNGKKTWLIRYVIDGKQIQFTLPKPFGSGEGFMSLVEAKAISAEIQALAHEGVDYQIRQAEQLQQKADAKKQKIVELKTFDDLYCVWIKDGVSRADGNKYITQSFNKHALPVLGKIFVRRLSEHDLRVTYRSIIESGKTATAVELSKDIKQMLRWAEKRQPWRALLINGNPADLVEIERLLPNDYTKVRKRMLCTDEIKRLKFVFDSTAKTYAAATNKTGIQRPLKKEVQIAMWLCLSTLCRIGELLMAEWKHVDFEARTWLIPSSNTKGERGKKRDQLVYLSDFALDQFVQLRALTSDSLWTFPASNRPGHVCVKSASKLIGDRQVKFKARSKKLMSRVENDNLVLGDEEWTPHDLRRTGATQMQKLKVDRNVINLCQNHVIGPKVDRHYLLDDYADEKYKAWHKLGDWLDSILRP